METPVVPPRHDAGRLGRERTKRRKAMETAGRTFESDYRFLGRERTKRRKAMETRGCRTKYTLSFMRRERTKRRKAMETISADGPVSVSVRLVGNALNAERQWRPDEGGVTDAGD